MTMMTTMAIGLLHTAKLYLRDKQKKYMEIKMLVDTLPASKRNNIATIDITEKREMDGG